MGRRSLWCLVALAALVFLCSCQMDDQSDSETHWQRALEACDANNECAPGYACTCGICTTDCASDPNRCTETSERAACLETSSEMREVCGEDAVLPSSMCARDCVEAAQCPGGQLCNGGFCRPPPANRNPAAREQDPWDGGELYAWSCGAPGVPSCCPREYYSFGELHTSFSFVTPPDPDGLSVDETALEHTATATWDGVAHDASGDGSEVSFTSPQFTIPLPIPRAEVEALAEPGDDVTVKWRTDEIDRDYLRVSDSEGELLIDFTLSPGDRASNDAALQLQRDEFTLRTEPIADDMSNLRCTTEINRCDNFYVIHEVILEHGGDSARLAPGVEYDFEANGAKFRLRHFMTVQRPPQSIGCAIGELLGYNYLVTRLPN